MRLLLDTHVLYWLVRDPSRVAPAALHAIEFADARFLSPASAMEIALKSRRGRMPGGDAILAAWSRCRQDMLATDLELGVEHLTRAGLLEWDHGDPFDRILVAQAQIDGLTLVTQDHALVAYPGVETLTW